MHADTIIQQLVVKQHGVVSRRQLLRAGITDRQIAWRIETGVLVRLHHGVFRVGPTAAPLAAEMAAALAAGARAFVSHASGIAVWSLGASPADTVHVTGPAPGRPRRGITLHRGVLAADERQRRHGIPVTSVARTLVDFAGVGAPRAVEQAVAEALARRLTSERQLRRYLDGSAGRRGARVLRELLEGGPAFVRSEGEERLLGLVRGTGLPPPEVNVTVAGYEIDFLWRKAGIAVEVDGHRYHRFRFEQDRRRDAVLRTHGISVIRVTWAQLERDAVATMVRLALLVGR